MPRREFNRPCPFDHQSPLQAAPSGRCRRTSTLAKGYGHRYSSHEAETVGCSCDVFRCFPWIPCGRVDERTAFREVQPCQRELDHGAHRWNRSTEFGDRTGSRILLPRFQSHRKGVSLYHWRRGRNNIDSQLCAPLPISRLFRNRLRSHA